jgi:hypothetical protein
VKGLFAPICAQIDPIRLGEMQRATEIAFAYGQRLDNYDKNLKPGALTRLVTGYPSHGVVIDRKEARDLFTNVRSPTAEELALMDHLQGMLPPDAPHSAPRVFWIEQTFPQIAENTAAQALTQPTQSQQPPTSSQEPPNDNAATVRVPGRKRGTQPSAGQIDEHRPDSH